MTAGIPIGGLCPACMQRVGRKAARIARAAALGTTALLGVYIAVSLPPSPTGRAVAAVAVAIWYLLTYRIAKRVALEWLR